MLETVRGSEGRETVAGVASGGRVDARTRLRLIVLALLVAAGTGVVGLSLGATTGHAWGAAGYLALVGFAVLAPGAIWAQVLAGQILIGSLLLGPGASPWWMLVPLLASVVATAELLGIAARLDSVVPRAPAADLRRAGRATLIAGLVFGFVAVAESLPGPGGLVAVALASAACVAVAALLLDQWERSPSASDDDRPGGGLTLS